MVPGNQNQFFKVLNTLDPILRVLLLKNVSKIQATYRGRKYRLWLLKKSFQNEEQKKYEEIKKLVSNQIHWVKSKHPFLFYSFSHLL